MASPLYQTIEHLFDHVKEDVQGIHVRMQDNSITNIDLQERANDVYFIMNGVEMGRFAPYSGQGYAACFIQSPRHVMKKAADNQIIMLRSICESNNILYLDS